MMAKILSVSEKKVVKWGQGYVVFLTPEFKKMNLTDRHKVSVSLVEEGSKKKIVIEKA